MTAFFLKIKYYKRFSENFVKYFSLYFKIFKDKMKIK